jgi:cyclase
MDVVASLYNRNNLRDIITRTAKEIFIPLTVGGGIRSIDDINAVLRSGADKVSLNTAAIKNPGIIKEAVKNFGSSTIVVAIEAIRHTDGRYLAYTENGRQYTGLEVLEWARRAEELGAGEIIITSVDREGTGSGFDIELVKMIADAVSVPVIAHGGAGNIDHIAQVISCGNADAVAISSILHYDFIMKHDVVIAADEEGNTEFLKKRRNFSKVTPAGLCDLKQYLHQKGINCRQCAALKQG